MGITANIDRITKITDEYLKAELPAPKSVKIEISPRCNLRCGFCALRTREKQPTQDMDFGLFQRITTEMREAGVEEIGAFYLGESFMNVDLLVDCIRHCKAIGFPYVFLTSNASLATPDAVKRVMEAGLDSLKWSVNAADPDQYEEIMGVPRKNWYKALENIMGAKAVRDEGGYKCGLYASSIRYDGEQQAKMQEMLKEHVLPFVDEHYWLPAYSMSLKAKELHDKWGWNVTVGNIGRYDEELGTGNRVSQSVCWAVVTEGHVRADGHLSACCFGATDQFDVGDLNKQSFMEAWNSEAFKKIRLLHLRVKDEGPEVLRGSMCEVCLTDA